MRSLRLGRQDRRRFRARSRRHENRKVPIKRPAANAHRPRVHAEMRRKRLRKSTSSTFCSRCVMQRPLWRRPVAAENWKSRRRGAEQVPPHTGPKQGNRNHAKSRICADGPNRTAQVRFATHVLGPDCHLAKALTELSIRESQGARALIASREHRACPEDDGRCPCGNRCRFSRS